jgi:hypothetical protein
MNDTAVFLAIGTGTLAGILYGQKMSEQLLTGIVAKMDRRIRELRCVFLCGRVGSLLTALPTFFLIFVLPHHFNTDPHGVPGILGPMFALGIGLLAATLLAGTLILGAAVGAAAGKGIATITRDTHPANHPPRLNDASRAHELTRP